MSQPQNVPSTNLSIPQQALQTVSERYKNTEKNKYLKALIYGRYGTGKTRLAITSRLPVLIHSFDPGGCQIQEVRAGIDKGWIIVDDRFEGENLEAPKMFDLWMKEMRDLERKQVFSEIGTFMLDSTTTWYDSGHHTIAVPAIRTNKSGEFEIKDWGKVYSMITVATRLTTNMPCDVIFTGHIAMVEDKVTSQFHTKLAIQGSSSDKLPAIFSELWVLQSKPTPDGLERFLLTQTDGKHEAKTRLGGNKVFDRIEHPNIMYLLQKAKLNPQHKPPFQDLPPVLEDPLKSRGKLPQPVSNKKP